MKSGLKLSWFFLFLNLSVAYSQFPGGIGGSSSAPSQQLAVESDSIDVLYFYQDNIHSLISFSDTLLNNYLEQYDPARRRIVDHAQLGNLGTAVLPQFYESQNHKGLDIGFHQYDIYNIHYKDIPFYKVDKPFSDLFFVQGPTQNDTYFKAKFTRDFAKGVNFSVDFKRMNNEGQLKSQEVINTAFGLGFWYHDKGGKYDAFLTYASSSNEVEDNGGVDTSKIGSTNLDRIFNVPVNLRTANTFYVNREYAFSQQYNLLGTPDSVKQKNNSRRLVLNHDLVFKTKVYKFYDTEPPVDTVYYQHLQLDDRGLRYLIKDNSIENIFAVSTSKSGAGSRRDFFKVSLEHQLHFLKQEPNDSIINQLILGGQWNFVPTERLKLETHLNYNLWDNFGDYRLGGNLLVDFGKAGFFKASVINQLYSPSLIQQQMFISEQQLWKNDFKKTFETNLSATYGIPKLGFSVTGQYNVLTNLIYFDTLSFPKQISAPVNILQLIINQNFKVGKFHLDNTVALQTTTEDIIRLPALFSKHNLYFESELFKKQMLFRVGMDLRLVSNYFANYYQPLIGNFRLQNSQEVALYPVVDAYASFKVKHFRFFIKTENLTQLVNDQLYYQVAGYAQPYMTIKFGVYWQLMN